MSRRPKDSDLPTPDESSAKAPARTLPADRLDSFYRDLESLLLQQLKDDPKQHHVRLKLLELYYETRRTEDFMKQARTLAAVQRDHNAREWQKCISMGM